MITEVYTGLCGITGIYSTGTMTVHASILHEMNRLIRHRGPDDEGYVIYNLEGEVIECRGDDTVDDFNHLRYIDEAGDLRVGLGNRRLSIIDPSPKGHQPMVSKDNRYSIVYNGELYNYREIRKELESKYEFKSDTDTEVILYSVIEWGLEKALSKFIGMYAFLIYDKEKNILYGARDRFGIKPLFYTESNGVYYFASEIKSFKPIVRFKPNMKKIYEYLTFTRIIDEETFFNDIYQIKPGHYFILREGEMTINRYWNLSIEDSKIDHDIGRIVSRWRDIFYDSIKIHLRTDVPLGFAISGGIDSSGLIAVSLDLIRGGRVRERGIDPVKLYSFSSIIDDPKIGEGKYVDILVKHFNIDLVGIKPDAEDVAKDLEKFIYYQEEPPEGPSVFSHWCVVKEASKYVKVLLDGQGGDELLAGYHAYIPVYLKGLLKRGAFLKFFTEAFRLKDLILSKFKLGLKVYTGRRKRLILELLSDEIRSAVEETELKMKSPKANNLKEALLNDLTGGRLHEILRYEDRNSMAFSLEIRVPYVNHVLAEFMMKVPEEACIYKGWTKYIHREMLKGLLPDEVRLRRTKIGFEVPEAKWLRDLEPFIKDKFKDPLVSKLGIINRDTLNKKFEEFCRGRLGDEYARVFWRILFLEEWLRIYIKEN